MDRGRERILEGATVDMITATSRLQLKAMEVRSSKPNWKSYLTGGMISQDDYNFITQFESSKAGEKKALLEKARSQCAKTFVNLMTTVSKDQTVQYVLTLIDDMLQEDRSRVEIFNYNARKQKQSVWTAFVSMLNRQDGFIVNQVSRIIAKLACWSPELMDGADLKFYLSWLRDQLKIPGNDYVQTTARCLQMMLRIDEYRFAFLSVEGVPTIVSVLAGKPNFQLQYQLVFCLWCLTFNCGIAERLSKFSVIPTVADLLTESSKEKVIRIILSTFRNLLEKPDNSEIKRENALQMVQYKVLKSLELLQEKKYDDTELIEDMEFLTEQLQLSVQDLSSFDEYAAELKSGRLQWSPVHKSEKFWRENAQRFNEKNFEMLKILIKILEVAQDPLILCVASHDVGEYVRHYPRGKNVIDKLEGKQLVMKLLTHEDPNVRYHALLAVQKIMVHNWEYLGKQIEQEKPSEAKSKAVTGI
jgi:V-type H+-transporting ATPase subunit H